MAAKKAAKRKQHFVHKFLTDRNIEGAWVVIRIDDFKLMPSVIEDREFFRAPESQGYGHSESLARRGGFNIWPTEHSALKAAEWAVGKFGNQYGVFRMCYVVERRESPIAIHSVMEVE